MISFKRVILSSILLCFFTGFLWSQEHKKELLFKLNRDLDFFQSVVESSHPSPYRYVDKTALDSLFKASQFTETDSLSYLELEKRVRIIISKIGCVHTYIVKPKRRAKKVFPISIYAENEKLFALSNLDSSFFKSAQEIISINGNPSKKIVSSMLNYRPSDGYNTTFKYKLLNYNTWFSLMYAFYFDDDSIKTITLKSCGEDSLNWHCKMVKLSSKKEPKEETKPDARYGNVSVDYYTESSCAHVKITSFSAYPLIGKSINGKNYKKALKDIEKGGFKNLILDLRDNTGGDALSGYRLVSYFIPEDHKVSIIHPKSKIFKHATFGSKMGLGLNVFLGHAFSGRIPAFKDRGSYVKVKSRKALFTGKVYVLVNGLTLSTASNVAALLKHKGNAIIAGTASGGGSNYLNAYVFPRIKFPNSKIQVQVPQYSINLNTNDTCNLGVKPDIDLKKDLNNLTNRDDWMLDELIQIVSN